jgi:hypothetical protein
LSSSHASARRGAPSLAISLKAIGCEAPTFGFVLPRPAAALRTWNSWSVFQAWQCGHWPAQRRLSPPQSAHTNVIVPLGIC